MLAEPKTRFYNSALKRFVVVVGGGGWWLRVILVLSLSLKLNNIKIGRLHANLQVKKTDMDRLTDKHKYVGKKQLTWNITQY